MDLTKYSWIAWILTAASWFVTFLVYKYTGKRTEMNKTIDSLVTELHALEDMALDYWIKASKDIYPYQLNLTIKRITGLSRELCKIDEKWLFPSENIKLLRQSVTLNIESRDGNGVSEYSQRAREIMGSVEDFKSVLARRF